MQKLETRKQSANRYSPSHYCPDQYASVEIPNIHAPFCYHFKLWRMDNSHVCILVKEDSQLLPRLKEGDRLNMKYYCREAVSDSEFRETDIQMIRKAENGRFKGHYLVYLDILN